MLTRAGQFQDMLGIEEGSKITKERALLFSKQETIPDL
jgi:hypothetical protein